MKYYILRNGEIKGPLSFAVVCEMLQAGAIQDTTLIAQEGARDWSPLGPYLEAHTNEIGTLSSGEGSARSMNPDKSRKWFLNRRFVIPSVVFLIVGIWLYQSDGKLETRDRTSDSGHQPRAANDQPSRQKANRPAYESYMQGYMNPEEGDVAELLVNSYSGEERQVCVLIILGAQDRRAGLPVRFEVEE